MAAAARAPHFADWPMPQDVTETSGVAAARSPIAQLRGLPMYSIINGDQSTIIPYLVRSTLPEYAKWVPIAGLRHESALDCADAFIRSHIWHISTNAGDKFTAAQARKAGIILGTARAVIYANYEISAGRLNTTETTAPVMAVVYGANGAVSYRCLAEDPRTEEQRAAPTAGQEGTSAFVPDPRGILTGEFTLTPEEEAAVSAITKAAQAVIPLQGYSLITDGHHYISDPARSSYKACLAVERQHWTVPSIVAWFDDASVDARDLLWHKSGHPVSISVKEFAATSEAVAENLRTANLGGAAVRLPAVESEVKAVSAYLRVTSEVKAAFESRSGVLDNSLLQELQRGLSHFPRAQLVDGVAMAVPAPMMIGEVVSETGVVSGGVRVSSRQEVIRLAKEILSRNAGLVALAFGYYVAMSEATAMTSMVGAGRGGGDSLLRAYSLKKLQTEHMTSYNDGMEYYRDHQAARARARKEGRVEAPKLIIS